MAKKSNKFIDKQMVGTEPAKGTDFTNNPAELRAYRRFYAYHLSMEKCLKWVKKWAKDNNDTEVVEVSKAVNKNYVETGFAFLCRMMTLDCKFGPDTMAYFTDVRQTYIEKAKVNQKKVISEDKKAKKARAAEAKHQVAMQAASDEIEELTWRFIEHRRKHSFSAKALKARHGLSDVDMQTLAAELKPYIDELHELVFKKPKDLKEAYAHIKNHKGYYAIMSEIYNDLVFESTAKKTARKRKAKVKKAPSAEKLIKKIKYQAEDTDLKIRSLHPVEIIGASKLWVYSTKYRQIIQYVAKEGGFSVKGASLTNVEKAIKKRLRKPEQDIGSFRTGTATRRLKAFNKLTTKEAKATCRMQPHYIILKKE